VAHEDRHPSIRQTLLQAFHDRNREAAEAVRRNQAHRQALPAVQAQGQVVWPEVQLLGDRDNLVARLLTKRAVVVQSLARTPDADVREPRDVADRKAPRAMLARFRPLGHFTAPLKSPDT